MCLGVKRRVLVFNFSKKTFNFLPRYQVSLEQCSGLTFCCRIIILFRKKTVFNSLVYVTILVWESEKLSQQLNHLTSALISNGYKSFQMREICCQHLYTLQRTSAVNRKKQITTSALAEHYPILFGKTRII